MNQEQLVFILDRFYYGWKMNALVFDEDDRLMEFCMGTIDKVDSSSMEAGEAAAAINETVGEFFPILKAKCKEAGLPVIHMEEDGIYYIVFCDAEERTFIFGPVSAGPLSFAQQLAYRKRHHVPYQKYMVPKVSFAKSLNGVALVYYMLTGKQVTEQEIMERSGIGMQFPVASTDMLSYEMQNPSEEKQHLAYQDEVKWTMEIENGTLREKENRMTPENIKKMEQIGVLSDANSLKQFEYMAVTSTILASRAAIRGGMNAYEAYQLSELFLQKISRCTNVMELLQIHVTIAEEFAKQVRLAKENRTLDCVEQCKAYIARHRKNKFSLTDVADAVGKNPSYLSRAFSEQTGMTMQEYALNVRLEAAANMLKYSNESVGDIAEYLNFPSQSYFGEQFKKRYGESPAKYRKQKKIRDFKE